MSTPSPSVRNPFIVGSWVRGEDFFGRDHLIEEILDGERHSLWVLGARRLGKTSLLKEVENRVHKSRDTAFVALYWDLQGSGDARGLAETLLSSIEDSEAFRRATDVTVDELESLPVAEMLATLVRRTVRSGWRLLLLLDEAEELLVVGRSDPGILAKLRRVLSRGPDIRSVLTATRLLARLDDEAPLATSPFLQGFIPPVYLTPLTPEECRPLLARGSFTDEEIDTVVERSACHPFLVQLLAEVAREGARTRHDLSTATGQTEEALEVPLYGLTMLGYLARDGEEYRLASWLFERWLRRRLATGS